MQNNLGEAVLIIGTIGLHLEYGFHIIPTILLILFAMSSWVTLRRVKK